MQVTLQIIRPLNGPVNELFREVFYNEHIIEEEVLLLCSWHWNNLLKFFLLCFSFFWRLIFNISLFFSSLRFPFYRNTFIFIFIFWCFMVAVILPCRKKAELMIASVNSRNGLVMMKAMMVTWNVVRLGLATGWWWSHSKKCAAAQFLWTHLWEFFTFGTQ